MKYMKSMRIRQKFQKGFTLVEIMIVIGIISMLAAFAIPGYREYMSSASISKVNSHYEEAVRLGRSVFMKDQAREAMSGVSSRPKSQQDWLDLLNKSAVAAPGGGLAFEASVAGNAQTGAIGIQSNADGSEVVIVRPAYVDVVSMSATLTAYSQDFVEL